ncbi:MAG: hypothetical protein AAFY72_03030 [Cyanobacteria bacterium J06649_4]
MKRTHLLLLLGLVTFVLVTAMYLLNPKTASSKIEFRQGDIPQTHTGATQGFIAQYPYPVPSPPIDERIEAVRGLSATEIASLINRDYPGWKDSLPSCPCRVANIDDATFVRSSWIAQRYQRNIIDYHPGAFYDYRQTSETLREYSSPKNSDAVAIRPGQQCTYDEEGNLINHGPGAGTPDIFGPEGTSVGSFVHDSWDVSPFQELVGDSTSNIINNSRGLRRYHQTWTPSLGQGSRGESCPINPRPIQEGVYNAGSRYIAVVYSDSLDRNRICYEGISVPPGRYAVAVGETTGNLSYSLEHEEGFFTIDGWEQYGIKVILGQDNNKLLVTHRDTDWTGEYEFFTSDVSASNATGALARCLRSQGSFFETAPGYQINR